MALINNPGNPLTATLAEFAAPFNTFFSEPPEYRGPDFKDGFIIEEILPASKQFGPPTVITLRGTQLPYQPFTFGGEQKLVKEFYPGNSEPTVQVLGAREDDIKINGKFKSKLYKTEEFRAVPGILQDQIDKLRQRGNLIKFSLGEWVRYGFILRANFSLKTLAEIDWEMDLLIIGDKPPSGCLFLEQGPEIPDAANIGLIAAAGEFEAQLLDAPPLPSSTIFGLVGEAISGVASALALVTIFVDQVFNQVDQAQKLANKAVGLIKNAQTSIAIFKKKLALLDLYLGTDPLGSAENTANEAQKAIQAKYILGVKSSTIVPKIALSPAQKAAASAGVSKYTTKVSSQQKAAATPGGKSIEKNLADMLAMFKKLAGTVPAFRHLVKEGDSLQKISVKYYQTPDNWKAIYDHNKLTSTDLVPGKVLEIPKL